MKRKTPDPQRFPDEFIFPNVKVRNSAIFTGIFLENRDSKSIFLEYQHKPDIKKR